MAIIVEMVQKIIFIAVKGDDGELTHDTRNRNPTFAVDIGF